MAFWEAGFGGNSGGQFRIRVHADVVAQEEENNRSLVRYTAYVDRIASGSRIWTGYNTYGNTNINGYNPQRGPYRYDTTGAGRVITMAANEDYWVGHDGNGNANPYYGANYDPANSPYWTGGSTGGHYWLPPLYRYADPTVFEVVSVTDVSMTLRIATNRVVNSIAISLTAGGNWYYFDGDTTNRLCTIGSAANPLPSGKTFPIRISLRRRASGYWKEAGNWNVATASQNNFFEIGDF